MGMYTGLRGIVVFKPAYKQEINRLFTEFATIEWRDLRLPHTEAIRDFVMENRAGFIPFGAVCYMPDDWEEFRNYDVSTGVMSFSCSLKNYEDEIGKFLAALPELADYWDLESLYEECDEPTRHTGRSEEWKTQ